MKSIYTYDLFWTGVHFQFFLLTPFIWAKITHLVWGKLWASLLAFALALPMLLLAAIMHPIWVLTTYTTFIGAEYFRKRRLTPEMLFACLAIASGFLWGFLKKFYYPDVRIIGC